MEVAFEAKWGNGRAWYPKGSRECVGYVTKRVSEMYDCPKDYTYKRVYNWSPSKGDEYKCYYKNKDYRAARRDKKTLVIPRRWRGPH